MERIRCHALVLAIVLLPLVCRAQVDRIVIAAGTPEDQALRAISNEQDGKKKVTLYEDFLQKFASNPAAVAYGNSQLSQYYQGTGDLQKAGSYDDKALALPIIWTSSSRRLISRAAREGQRRNQGRRVVHLNRQAAQARRHQRRGVC